MRFSFLFQNIPMERLYTAFEIYAGLLFKIIRKVSIGEPEITSIEVNSLTIFVGGRHDQMLAGYNGNSK